MNKFCPKCGKLETKNIRLIKGLCSNCLSEDLQILKEYKTLRLVICQKCKSYLDKNKWNKKLSENEEVNVREIMKKLLLKRLKSNEGAKIKNVSIGSIEKSLGKNSLEVDVFISGFIHGVKAEENHPLQIIKEITICNLCKKKGSNYFEAIIQIRPKNKDLLKFIKNDVEADGKTFISMEEEKKFGYDLHITSKNYLQSILPKIKKEFKAETKISATLFGKKDGKDIYRVTLLVRLKE